MSQTHKPVRKQSGGRICLALLVLVTGRASITSLLAQVPTAQLTVVVRDSSGAVIPAATVKLLNQNTGIEYPTTPLADGQYLATPIPIGRYTVTVSASGFQTSSHTGLTLEVGQAARLQVTLNVGTVNQQVTVTGTSTMLQTQGAAQGMVISEHQITDLPLNGRNFPELAVLAPGVADGFSNNYQVYFFGERAQYQVAQANGVRSEFSDTTIDGVNAQVNDRRWTSVIYTSPDMLQEMKAETSNYSSEFTSGGGLVMNLATKSGANAFHGSGFEFLQNGVLNSKNVFQPVNQPKPNEKYNQFGGTIGGPIRKDKTFFFFSYQGMRERVAFVSTNRVPTALERQGNFSESLATGEILYDPSTTVVNPSASGGYSRSAFQGNIIPSNEVSTIAVAIASAEFPAPNAGGLITNFNISGVNPTTDNQFSVRIDQNFSSKDAVFGRLTWDHFNSFTQGLLPSRGTTSIIPAYNSVIGWNHIFTPTLLSQFRIGWNRWVRTGGYAPAGQILEGPGTSIPIPGLDTIPQALRTGIGTYSISGIANGNFGLGAGINPQHSVQINDKVSWTHGKHSINFGASYRTNADYTTALSQALPVYGFTGTYTITPFGSLGGGNINTGYADFLLGLGYQYSPQEQAYPEHFVYNNQPQLDLFVDDTIRLTPNLNITLGTRYTDPGDLTEQNHLESSFNFLTGTLDYPSDAPNLANFEPYMPYPFTTNGPDYLLRSAKKDFQPRISVAYSPTGRWVIRTGYAMYDATPQLANQVPMSEVAPFIISSQETANNVLYPSDAFQAFTTPAGISATGLMAAFTYPSLQSGERVWFMPNVQMWNFEVQRQVSPTILVTAGYVGNSGHHLNNEARPNAPLPGPGSIQPRRPYPQFGRIILIETNGVSNYNGLQTSVRKTTSKGLSFTVAYTYSKSLGDTDDVINIDSSNLQWYGHLRQLDYGPQAFDYTHIFRSSFIYELPFGKGRAYASNMPRMANAVLGGWRISGIWTEQSGQTFTVSGGFNNNNERGNHPNAICNGNISNRTLSHDFNTSCFVTGAAFTMGTEGRDTLRQRPLRNLDTSLSKSFVIPGREGMSADFRFEMFDVTNTPFYSLPNASCCTSPTFGVITSTARPNRIGQAALKIIF